MLLSEVPRHYRSCLLSQGNISRLTLCLVRIELKLRRFRKPTFIGLKSGVSCISRVFYKAIFIGLNCRCGLHLKLKELLHYCCLSLAASMGTTIEQYRSGIGCHNNFVKAKDIFFMCTRAILEYDAYDVLLKCVFLVNIKRRCRTFQVVE